MDITREYFTKVEFVKSVKKMSEFEEVPEDVKQFAEEQKPSIEELKKQFNNYRNRNNKIGRYDK